MSTLYDMRSGTLVKSKLYTNGIHLKDAFAFDPLSLFSGGEQGVWYDPSDLSTLFQDVAGTVPVTKDGDPVALMKDKSGNGNHAVQTVSESRPIYKTDGTLHWLEFDGVDDYLFAQIEGLSNFSSFIAGASFTTSKSYSVIFSGWNSSSRNLYNNITMNRKDGTYVARSNGSILNGPIHTPVGNVFTYISDESKLNLINPVTGDVVNYTPAKAYVTDTLYIGSSPESHALSALQGKIWGIVIVNGNTNNYDALKVNNKLRLKAGVTL